MRVVIVTGTRAHHKYLCAKLSAAFDVVAIIHPAKSKSDTDGFLRRLRKQRTSHGWPTVLMYVFGKIGFRGATREDSSMISRSAFAKGVEEYDRLPRAIVRPQFDIHGTQAAASLRALQPDVTICLGGPVYPGSFIDASPLTLNFHSGISPLYNGTASIHFAFANGHPHLCGGTLMMMNNTVDGGGILGHYLPEIRADDSPGSLFDKTVWGAAEMYARVLQRLQENAGQLPAVAQPRPLFYTRSFEFGWYQKAMIARYRRATLAAKYQRPEMVAEYWRESSEAAAREACRTTLDRLIWGTTWNDLP
jgi:folate-dependent phosphoribosylglycinamide formyltransferase PurN